MRNGINLLPNPSVPRALKIRLVCATKQSSEYFFAESELGRSRLWWDFPSVQLRLFYCNTSPLPLVYNTAIREAENDPAILVFLHDDVLLFDNYWIERLYAAFQYFDIVGIAGNKRRLPRQPAWVFVDEKFTWDSAGNLSGRIAHGREFPPYNLSCFGPALQEVKLLDGVFLAVDSRTLHQYSLFFDERFSFHLYDLDFCREAEGRGLRMGTGEISLVHGSAGGGYGSESWKANFEAYLAKWGE